MLVTLSVLWARSHLIGYYPGWLTWQSYYDGVPTHMAGIPYWTLIVPTVPLPLLWLLARRRWTMDDRDATGRCFNCGYDLRAARLST